MSSNSDPHTTAASALRRKCHEVKNLRERKNETVPRTSASLNRGRIANIFAVALSTAGVLRLSSSKSPRQIALLNGEEMDLRTKTSLIVVAVLALSLPIWARTDSAQLVIDHPVTIGTQQLEPGTYNLKANDGENQISIVRADNGKTVASVPCEWVQLAQKPRQTEILFNADRVVEIDFGGKTRGVAFR